MVVAAVLAISITTKDRPRYWFPDWLADTSLMAAYPEEPQDWVYLGIFSLFYLAAIHVCQRYGLPLWAFVIGCGGLVAGWSYNVLYVLNPDSGAQVDSWFTTIDRAGWVWWDYGNSTLLWSMVLAWLWGCWLWCLVRSKRWRSMVWVPWGMIVLHLVFRIGESLWDSIGEWVLFEPGYDWYYLHSISQMAAWCFTLVFVLLALRGDDANPLLIKVKVQCPRCETLQQVVPPESRCQQCKMILRAGAIEPRCPHCDYLLHSPTAPECPECGGLLPEEEIVSREQFTE